MSLDYVDPEEPFLTSTAGFKTCNTSLISYNDVVVTPLTD